MAAEKRFDFSVANGAELKRSKVRVGVIGLGRAFFENHLPAFRALSDLIELVAVCDTSKERRDVVEKEFPDVLTYRRIDDMLDQKDIEVVLCSLPTNKHVKCALESLRREKYTVVESPISTTPEEMNLLNAANAKARGKLYCYVPGLFSPDFRIAQMMLDDPRLGGVFEICIHKHDYIRRDDWQSLGRCDGGCLNYFGTDIFMMASRLMRYKPEKMWSETRRLTSLGDAEDYAHVIIKARNSTTMNIEISGAELSANEPLFTFRGAKGKFTVHAGATQGNLHVIDPQYDMPRRRSSVGTPPLTDMHENLPVVDIPINVFGSTEPGNIAFWRSMYMSVRTAQPFLYTLDEVNDALRYIQLVRRASV